MQAPRLPFHGVELLGEAKVTEGAMVGGGIKEEVGRLDIAVKDVVVMGMGQGREEAAEVRAKLRDGHGAVVHLRGESSQQRGCMRKSKLQKNKLTLKS